MKTKKTILNILTDVVPLIILAILGVYKVKLFLMVLGSETLGLYQLFNNIMVYVAIVDGGLSSALLFSLYKPNSDNDKKKFNELLSGGLKTFSKIGMYVFGIAALISLFIIFLIKDSPFTYWYIVLTFILFSLSNVIEYFFVPYNALLEVKEKKYIYNIINQVAQIMISITEIILLLKHIPFVYILLSHSVIKIISKIIEVYVCKKEFPSVNFKEDRKDYSFKKYLGSLMVHKVNGLIGSNVDSLIISSVMGLNSVAIYSAYSYIVLTLKKMLGKLSSSMTAIIGNGLQKEKDKMYELYNEYNSALFFIAIIVCVPLLFAINDFIRIFYNGEIMTSTLLAISFSLLLFVYIIRLSTSLFVDAGGLYKETKVSSIFDTILNLSLSIILVFILGIPGVVIATIISTIISEYVIKTIIVYRNIFKMKAITYFINNIKFFIIFIIDIIINYFVVNMFTINSLLIWLVFFTCLTIINLVLILIVFSLLKETKFYSRFLSIIKSK